MSITKPRDSWHARNMTQTLSKRTKSYVDIFRNVQCREIKPLVYCETLNLNRVSSVDVKGTPSSNSLHSTSENSLKKLSWSFA